MRLRTTCLPSGLILGSSSISAKHFSRHSRHSSTGVFGFFGIISFVSGSSVMAVTGSFVVGFCSIILGKVDAPEMFALGFERVGNTMFYGDRVCNEKTLINPQNTHVFIPALATQNLGSSRST